MRFTLVFGVALAAVLLAAPAASRRVEATQAGASAAAKPPAVTAAETPCDLWVYVLDPDPQGVNVRQGPGKQFAAVGKLPHDEYSLMVHVTGASGQWVRVSEAERMESGDNVFKGAGWVYGPGLATQTKDYAGLDPEEPRVKLYKEPSKRGAVVLRLANETEVALTGCKGRWARVRHKNVEAWLAPDSQCHSTITTCS
ncbi:MAG TPA: SH3 domain-containing protein [Pyrinomonadaceae bacterium]|jgi:SH3-like domain-containing protein